MSEDGTKPSTQALDAFAQWMRRVEQDAKFVDARLDSLERKALPSTIPAGMDDFERRISVLEERERTHDARIEGHYSRIEALEASADARAREVRERELNPPKGSSHWNTDYGATVQLRRDVGTLVRAARELVHKIKPYTPHWSTDPVEAALKAFEGDYT